MAQADDLVLMELEMDIEVDEMLAGVDFNIIESTEDAPVNQNSRFRKLTEAEVQIFLDEQENKNTRIKTENDVKLLATYLNSVGEMRNMELIPPSKLNDHIGNFFLAIQRKNGTEFEPTTLRSFRSSFDRHLRKKNYGFSLINDIQFSKCREMLKLKMKQLKGMGKGNLPNAAEPITDAEIDALYQCKHLGPDNPKSLQNSLWLICITYFGMRTGIETHELRWGDIDVRQEESGEEYLIYTQERQTKTRSGTNPRNVRKVKPRAYSIPDNLDRCPVALYNLFKSKRPKEMLESDSPFLLTVNILAPRPGQAWYKNLPMGINKIYSIMKEMKSYLKPTGKKLVPYRYNFV
jgi:hypothetical protein